MGAPEANTTLIYGVHIRESANDGSDFSNAASDYRVLFLGEDGQLHAKDSAGTVTDIGGGSSGIPATLLDAKGDLIAASAADTAAKLTVGSNGQFLRANSGATTGLEWVGMSVAADCSADVNLGVDTATDVTGCSISLPAGTWEIDGWITYSANASYTVQYITDNSNVIQYEMRGVASATGPTTWTVSGRVSPSSTTTYKLRGQSNGNADITRLGAGTAVGTRIRAIRVA